MSRQIQTPKRAAAQKVETPLATATGARPAAALTTADKVRLTTRVSPDLAAALAQHCEETGRTQNWVVESAIKAWLQQAQ